MPQEPRGFLDLLEQHLALFVVELLRIWVSAGSRVIRPSAAQRSSGPAAAHRQSRDLWFLAPCRSGRAPHRTSCCLVARVSKKRARDPPPQRGRLDEYSRGHIGTVVPRGGAWGLLWVIPSTGPRPASSMPIMYSSPSSSSPPCSVWSSGPIRPPLKAIAVDFLLGTVRGRTSAVPVFR